MSLRLARASVTLGAVAFLAPGVWSLLWPRSFHRHVALFEASHLIDSDLGGRAGDRWGLGLLAMSLTTTLVLQRRAEWRASPEERIVPPTSPRG